MKYTVEVAGKTFAVEIDGGRILLDGRPVEAALNGARGTGIRRLARGRSVQTLLAGPAEGRGAWVVSLAGCRMPVQVLDPRDLAVRNAGTRAGGKVGGTMKAPMPGMVLRVLVEAGAAVEPGQGLIVIEAMKMENELKARGPGTVTKVHVAPGSRVEKGAPLLDFA